MKKVEGKGGTYHFFAAISPQRDQAAVPTHAQDRLRNDATYQSQAGVGAHKNGPWKNRSAHAGNSRVSFFE